jgi:hypothetical protein
MPHTGSFTVAVLELRNGFIFRLFKADTCGRATPASFAGCNSYIKLLLAVIVTS